MGTVKMEHVWVTGDGCSEVCVCCCSPFVLKVGVVDALETHVGHTACSDVLLNC